ncbi:MAG: hypothetical protein ACYDAD_11695 [Acidimicrobiales bacterium]
MIRPAHSSTVCGGGGIIGGGLYEECHTEAIGWVVVALGDWAFRVFLCPAHLALWMADALDNKLGSLNASMA